MLEVLVLVGSWALPVIAGILTMLAIVGVKKLLDKMGIERSEKVDDMIDKYVNMGINVANVAGTKWLETQGVKMASGSKKARAVKVVLDELEQSGIKDVAESLISDRIEHWLEKRGEKPGIPSATADPIIGETV